MFANVSADKNDVLIHVFMDEKTKNKSPAREQFVWWRRVRFNFRSFFVFFFFWPQSATSTKSISIDVRIQRMFNSFFLCSVLTVSIALVVVVSTCRYASLDRSNTFRPSSQLMVSSCSTSHLLELSFDHPTPVRVCHASSRSAGQNAYSVGRIRSSSVWFKTSSPECSHTSKCSLRITWSRYDLTV